MATTDQATETRRDPAPSATDGDNEAQSAQRRSVAQRVALWRREFRALTGVDPADAGAVKARQSAHGLEPTGTLRQSTIDAARRERTTMATDKQVRGAGDVADADATTAIAAPASGDKKTADAQAADAATKRMAANQSDGTDWHDRTKVERQGAGAAVTHTVSENGHRVSNQTAVDGSGFHYRDSDTNRTGDAKTGTHNEVNANLGGVDAATEHSAKYTDKDGNEIDQKSKLGAEVGKEGVGVNASREKKVKQEDGTETSSSASGSAKIGKEGYEADVKIARSTKREGGEEREVSGGGSVALDRSGNLKKAEGEIELKRGGRGVTAKGRYEIHADAPVKTSDGKTTVHWTRTEEVELGGEAQNKMKKGSAAGSLDVKKAKVDEGVKVFEDPKEAAEFAEDPAAHSDELPAPPLSAAGAMKLQVGESIKETNSSEIGGGASGSYGAASGGVDAKKASSAAIEVKRVSASTVYVTISKSDLIGGGVHGGAYGVKLHESATRSKASQFTFSFDLTTKEGKTAFDAFVTDRTILDHGIRPVGDWAQEQAVDEGGVGFGDKASINRTETVTNTVTHDDHNNRTFDSSGEQADALSINVPLIKGHENFSTGIAQEEKNGQAVDTRITSKVDSTDAKIGREDLAEATGMHYDGVANAKSSGTWTVTSQLTPDEVRQLVQKVRAGHANFSALNARAGLGDQLKQRLDGAGGDLDAQMKAISQFVAAAGPRGMAAIREILGKKDQQFDLQLENDPHGIFTGPDGRIALEGRLRDYGTRLSAPSGDMKALQNDLQGEKAKLESQFEILRERKNYSDLPNDLRAQQMQRIQATVAKIDILENQVMARIRATPHERLVTPGAAPSKTAATTAGNDATRDQLVILDDAGKKTLERANSARDKSKLAHWVHYDAPYAIGLSSVQLNTGSADVADFRAAKDAFSAGELHFKAGNALIESLKSSGSDFWASADSPEKQRQILAGMVGMANQQNVEWSIAADQFEKSVERYQAIRHRHPDQENNTFLGYRHDPPPGTLD